MFVICAVFQRIDFACELLLTKLRDSHETPYVLLSCDSLVEIYVKKLGSTLSVRRGSGKIWKRVDKEQVRMTGRQRGSLAFGGGIKIVLSTWRICCKHGLL